MISTIKLLSVPYINATDDLNMGIFSITSNNVTSTALTGTGTRGVGADLTGKLVVYIDAFNETPLGTPDGLLTTFTLAHTPSTGTVQVFVNGVKQKPTTAYSVSVNSIIFTTNWIPVTNDEILINYKY